MERTPLDKDRRDISLGNQLNMSPVKEIVPAKKMRIGLMLDSNEVFAWIYHAIERLSQSNSILIALVIINNHHVSTKSGIENSFLFKWVNALDRKMFIHGKNAFALKSLDNLINHIEPVLINPENNNRISLPQIIQLIKTNDLDLVIDLSTFQKIEELTPFTRYGIWSYRFGGNQTIFDPFYGYWEVIQKIPKTISKLLIHSSKNGNSQIVYQSFIATHKLSPNRNRNSISWFTASFLVRMIEFLHRYGEDKFFEKIRVNKHSIKTEIEKHDTNKRPTSWDLLKNEIVCLGRIFKELWHRSLYKEAWYLLMHESQDPNFEINRCKKIIPPEDRFWADPFIIDFAGNNYIFVEEFLYKKNKGHISVIELTHNGDVKKYYPILEKESHLSYPCIFNHLGTFYMVPESCSTKSIELYECQIPFIKWKLKKTIMQDVNAVDPTLFFHHGKWWLFTGMREVSGVYPDVELFLFYADSLFSDNWVSHPCNPIISDVSRARPAGMPFNHHGKLYRPSQNCLDFYGSSFNINEIIQLSETDYKEQKILTVRPDNYKQIQATHTFNYFLKYSIMDALNWKPK